MDKTKIAVDIFNARAGDYQEKFMDVSLYHDTLTLFCNAIEKEDAQVLDLACGPGNITKYIAGLRPQFKILGIDLSPNMISLAQANNPQMDFKVMDCRDISNIGQKYNAVIAGFCLPYLDKDEMHKFIKDVYTLLEPCGVLYLSTMEDDYIKSGLRTSSKGDVMFMHYYMEADLTAALKQNNFTIMHMQRKKYTDKNNNTTIDIEIIAFKS